MLSKEKTTNESARKNRGGFLNGVLLLSVSTLICKVIGLLFKIPIINIVGIDGMAYFSSAYNVYMLLNSIAAAGLPVALSIMVSRNNTVGNRANVKRIFMIALSIFLCLGVAGALILYFGADAYSNAVGISGSAPAVRAIAPTLFFICIAGAIRGYFQGHKMMTPTAVSQLLESLGKLLLGVGFALLSIDRGDDLPNIAASAVAGLSAGVIISTIYLFARLVIFNRSRDLRGLPKSEGVPDRGRDILRELFWIALPITLSSCVTSLTSLADTALITNRLTAGGFAENAAVTLYSSYTNLAIPLFNLPPALIAPIAISLVPSLTSALTRRDNEASKRLFSSSVRLCFAFSLPAAAGIAVFAKPILLLLYPNEAEACSFAAPLLSVLAAAIVFSCMTTVLNAVLQAHMKPSLPIISMFAGAAVKIIIEYFLVGSDAGIMGAPISTVACTFTIMMLNIVFVTVYTPYRIEPMALARPFIATVLSIGSSACIYCLLLQTVTGSAAALLIAIVLAVLLYSISALLLGVVKYSDVLRLPFGKYVGKMLKTIKLIKE